MKSQFSKNRISKKSLSVILSIVSIIELILIITTATLAWFEGLTSLEITGESLKTASGLNSKFIVGEGDEYDTTAELNTFFHKQSFDKLSPVSSADGTNFYAITTGATPANQADYISAVNSKTATFRKLSEEEKNSSIVYFQFEVEAPSSDTDFWFRSLPTVKIGGTTLDRENNPFRFSFDDGTGAKLITTCSKYPEEDQANMRAVNSIDADGYATLNTTLITDLANKYIIDTEENNGGQYNLFTVPKGESRIVTVAIWIEAFDPAYNENIIGLGKTVDISIDFCCSWDVVDTIVFRDRTADQWVDTDDNGETKEIIATNLDTNKEYADFNYNSTEHTWTAEIPRAVQNIRFDWGDYNSWTPETRGANATYTLFGSTAGVWYDGEVDKITFSDYTSDEIVKAENPKMKVEVTYNGSKMTYSMTADAVLDGGGKSTWSMFVPSSVDTVVFNCFNSSSDTAAKYTWNAPDRIVKDETTGTETRHLRYYALDGGETSVLEGTPIYLSIPLALYNTNYNFGEKFLPAISYTSTQNIANVSQYTATTIKNLKKSEYITSGNHADTWPGTSGEMTFLKKTENNIYFVYYLDSKLPEGTYITFWSKSHINTQSGQFTDIDNNVSFAPAVQYKDGMNQFSIADPVKLEDQNFNGGCYVFTNCMTTEYAGSDGNVTIPGKEQAGQWGAPRNDDGTIELPDGTFQTFFIHPTTTATKVTAEFEYYGEKFTVEMKQSTTDKTKWYTSSTAIPDSVQVVTFTDNNGNKWTKDNTTGVRTADTNYYITSSYTEGEWGVPGVGTKTIYLKPTTLWSTDEAWFWVHAWGGSEEADVKMEAVSGESGLYSVEIPEDSTSIIFCRMNPAYEDISWDKDNNKLWNQTVDLTIPSDSDTFTITDWTNGTWYEVEEPEPASNILYLKPNSNWTQKSARFAAYFFEGSTSGAVTWVSMTDSDNDGIYEVTIPDGGWKKVIFCRMNPSNTTNSWDTKWNQTGDLTIPTNGNNLFTVPSGAWDGSTSTWSKME